MRILCCFLLLLFSTIAIAQDGEWAGVLIQDGQEYEMTVNFKKEGKKIIGYTSVVVGDSLYGGKIYGRIYQDRSMNLWDHQEEDIVYADTIPTNMRRRYQLQFRRSAFGDTIKGYWQEVQTHLHEFIRQGRVELMRKTDDSKA